MRLREAPIAIVSSGGTATLDFNDGSGVFYYEIASLALTEDTTLALTDAVAGCTFLLRVTNSSGVSRNFTLPAGLVSQSVTDLGGAIADGATVEFTGVLIGAVWTFKAVELS